VGRFASHVLGLHQFVPCHFLALDFIFGLFLEIILSTQYFRLPLVALALFAVGSLSSAVADNTSVPMTGHSDVTINEQLAKTTTPADHSAMAQRFEDEASAFDKQAAEHEQLAAQYRKHPNPYANKSAGVNTTLMAEHCDRIAKTLRTIASEAREVASLHHSAADDIKK
jgi:hypothetical protein